MSRSIGNVGVRSVAAVALGLLVLAPTLARAETLADRLESAARAWHEAGQFDGAILVARDGEVVWEGGFGPANREWDIPNAPGVRYPIASLTKQFTAVLVMQCVERGELSLEDTIVDRLPWYRADTGGRITIRDLLSHSSGLPDVPVEQYFDDRPEAEDPSWVVRTYCSEDPVFEPGTDISYTNTDYHVLGCILESVTKKTFEALLTERVLEPLGMKDTGVARRDRPLRHRADDYTESEGEPVNTPPYQWENWHAAGCLYSTVDDLHRWNRALANHELLSVATTETMLTPRTDIGNQGNYVALGSWVYPRRLPGSDLAPVLVERRGAIGGYTVLNVLVKDEGQWITILSNHYNEMIHTLPWARCLPLDLLLVLNDLEPEGPESVGDGGAGGESP
ncbi:MAG: serine hydrolase domain-containing protein [bacterium]